MAADNAWISITHLRRLTSRAYDNDTHYTPCPKKRMEYFVLFDRIAAIFGNEQRQDAVKILKQRMSTYFLDRATLPCKNARNIIITQHENGKVRENKEA